MLGYVPKNDKKKRIWSIKGKLFFSRLFTELTIDPPEKFSNLNNASIRGCIHHEPILPSFGISNYHFRTKMTICIPYQIKSLYWLCLLKGVNRFDVDNGLGDLVITELQTVLLFNMRYTVGSQVV